MPPIPRTRVTHHRRRTDCYRSHLCVAVAISTASLAPIPNLSAATVASWTNSSADFDWTNPLNWSPAVVPHAAGDVASFGLAVAGGTINLTGMQALAQLNLAPGSLLSYTLAPGSAGQLLLNNPGGNALLNVAGGSHTITAPVDFQTSTSVVFQTNSTLTLTSTIAQSIAPAPTLTLSGPGVMVVTSDNSLSGPINIGAGTTLQLGNGGTTGSFGAAPIAVQGKLTFLRSNDFALPQALTGSGSVFVTGRNVTANSFSPQFTGSLNITSGTLTVNSGVTALPQTFIAATGTLVIDAATTVQFNKVRVGGTLHNYGTIRAVEFNDDFTTAIPNAIVINDGTLEIYEDLIRGNGQFINNGQIVGTGHFGETMRCFNSGTITARRLPGAGPILYIDPIVGGGSIALTNTGTIRADGAILRLDFANIANAGGIIEIADQNVGIFNTGVSVTGGIIRSLGNGTITLTAANLKDVSLSGKVLQNGNLAIGSSTVSAAYSASNGTLTLTGALNNTSSITLVNTPLVAGTSSSSSLTGGGFISMTGTSSSITTAIVGGRFSTDNVISGQGKITGKSIKFTNSGTLTASSGSGFQITPAATSDGLVSPGLLRADGAFLTIDANANYHIDGPLQAINGGQIFIFGDVTLTGPVTLTNGRISVSGSATTITGAGTLTTGSYLSNHFTSDAVSVTDWQVGTGFHTLRPNLLTASKTNKLEFMVFNAALDLTNNALIVQPADSADKLTKLPTLQSQLASAHFNGTAGSWTGPGITSSTVAADPTHFTLALADNADLHYTSFKGQPTDDNSLLITQALFGDATIDNKVDAFDLNLLAAHWQMNVPGSGLTGSPLWSAGDFTNDGEVDSFDLNVLAANWQSTLPLESALVAFAQSSVLSTQSSSPIPEPTSLTLLLPISLLLRRPRPTAPRKNL